MRDSLEVEISMEDTPENYVFHMKVEGKPIKRFALLLYRVFCATANSGRVMNK